MSAATVRVALVTGGGAGIGRAIANRLASDGVRVFVTSRSIEPGPVAPGVHMLRLDTTDPASVASCVETVVATCGRLDILVNSIGNGMIGAVEETSETEARRLVDDIFWSAVRMIKAVLPIMREQGGGHIVTMSSLGGQIGFPFSAFYSAAKFALEGFHEALHIEVGQFGIKVSLIEPAGVSTPVAGRVPFASVSLPAYGRTRDRIASDVERSMRRGLSPEQVAQVVTKVVVEKRPRLRYVVGNAARFATSFVRLAPEWMVVQAKRKMSGLA